MHKYKTIYAVYPVNTGLFFVGFFLRIYVWLWTFMTSTNKRDGKINTDKMINFSDKEWKPYNMVMLFKSSTTIRPGFILNKMTIFHSNLWNPILLDNWAQLNVFCNSNTFSCLNLFHTIKQKCVEKKTNKKNMCWRDKPRGWFCMFPMILLKLKN